jgi:hypothetical protein
LALSPHRNDPQQKNNPAFSITSYSYFCQPGEKMAMSPADYGQPMIAFTVIHYGLAASPEKRRHDVFFFLQR